MCFSKKKWNKPKKEGDFLLVYSLVGSNVRHRDPIENEGSPQNVKVDLPRMLDVQKA